MRGKNLFSICLLAVLIASMAPINLAIASPDPSISVWSPLNVTNPGMTMHIQFRIAGAVDVHGWEMKIYWDLSLTGLINDKICKVTEGNFLKDVGETAGVWNKTDAVAGYIQLTNNLVQDLTASGSGNLVTLDILVEDAGESAIEIRDTLLWDGDLNAIPHTTNDGYFFTMKPRADFTWDPSNPWLEETVTFDASASYDPDNDPKPPYWPGDPTPGPISNYAWDFGDGTPVVNTASPITTHEYTVQRFEPYPVTLTVTDDEGLTWSKTKSLRIWRDAVLVDLWFDPTWWLDRDDVEYGNGQNVLIVVTVTNMGTQTEAVDLDLTIVHDETGYEPYFELWWGNPLVIAPGAGAFKYGGWMPLPNEDEPGYYTATLSMSVHDPEGEGDTSNNGPIVRHLRVTEANLIMARAETRHFRISKRGDELHLYGKAVNIESIYTAPAPLYTWIAFDVVDPYGDEFRVETGAVLLYNEEETAQLMTSITVEPGIYSFTAYACYSYMSQGEVYFYEDPDTQAAWPDACRGFSMKVKTFTVLVVED